MNTSRTSKRDQVQNKAGGTKSPGRRNASPHSPPPYSLRSGRKPGAYKDTTNKKNKQSPSGRKTSKGKSSSSKSPSSHLDNRRSSHKKNTAAVEDTIKDETSHKAGQTTPPAQNASPKNTSKKKGNREPKSGEKSSKSKSSSRKSKGGSKSKQGKSPARNHSTPTKSARSTARKESKDVTPSRTGKKTPSRKSSAAKGNQSDRIEEETGGKKSTGKRTASRTPGKIEEESNKKGGKESAGKRSPGRMLEESGKKTPSRQGKTPSKGKGSKGKSSVGKGSKSPGHMIEESAKKSAKKSASKGKTSKRKADEISKDPDLGAQGDLQALGGTTTHVVMKKVKKNDEIVGKEALEQIKIVDLAKKKPSTSSRRQTRASSGKAEKESAEKNKSAEKERSSSGEKKSKKKVLNSKKKAEPEEEANGDMVEMKLLEMRVVVKGKNYCIWRKITSIDDIPMTKLARIIVTAMGWLGCWDWKFKIDGKEVLLPPDDEDDREEETRQMCYGDNATLTSFGVKEGDKFQFIYHPSSKNPWVHEIVIERLDRVQVDMSENGRNSEKAKMVQHAVVMSGSLAVPPDRISPVDYEKVFEDFDKGDREFEKWKRELGDDFNMNTFNKTKINETLKIHLYDEAKMDPKIKEGDIFFKW